MAFTIVNYGISADDPTVSKQPHIAVKRFTSRPTACRRGTAVGPGHAFLGYVVTGGGSGTPTIKDSTNNKLSAGNWRRTVRA